MTASSPAAPTFTDVSGLLFPRSVAVIGASDRAGNLGGDTIRRLVKFKFPGPVWAVNPSSTTVGGVPCVPKLADLPGVPELIIMAIPAEALEPTVREAARLGVRNGIAFAGGLADAGGAGIELQRALVATCRATGFRLCGPNCVGIINTALPATLTFATVLHEVDTLGTGSISMVSQSGGIGTNAFTLAREAGFNFRHFVSSGNEAVVDFADYLYAFARDEGTRVICAYLEGAGDGDKLVAALAEARRQQKPVVMIKSGATPSGARAALAHTGALVGEDSVFDAVASELGVIRVGSVEEMVDVALMLVGFRDGHRPQGPGVGIVTFGGGFGVLAADQCGEAGLTTPALGPERVAALKPHLVAVATAANPLDLTPTTAFRAESLAQLPAALDAFAADPAIHSLMFLAGGLASKAGEIADVMHGIWSRTEKPVIVAWPAPPTGILARLAERGMAAFIEPKRAARALGHIVRAGATLPPRAAARTATARFDWSAHGGGEMTARVVTEDRTHAILAAAGLAVAPGALGRDVDGVVAAARKIGFPLALKGISPRVTHRAAAGLLAIGLADEAGVRAATERLFARAKAIGVTLDGLYVQRMIEGGTELLISAFRDPVFGPAVTCGTGGGLTELVGDVVTARAPLDAAQAADLIARLRISKHARDGSGKLPPDAAARYLARVSEIAATAPWPRFMLEINPIKWRREDAVAVDGLLIIGEPE